MDKSSEDRIKSKQQSKGLTAYNNNDSVEFDKQFMSNTQVNSAVSSSNNRGSSHHQRVRNMRTASQR